MPVLPGADIRLLLNDRAAPPIVVSKGIRVLVEKLAEALETVRRWLAPVNEELVKSIVELLREHPLGVVEVAGDPWLARRLRAEIGPRVADDEVSCPTAVIDATGSPHVIREALRRLADHGLLVLTATVRGGTGSLDYYQDVHLRDLTIVGLPDSVA